MNWCHSCNFIFIYTSHIHTCSPIFEYVSLLTVYSCSSLNKSLSMKSPALEQDGGRALLELSRRESIPPRPSEMEVALFHATIKLNQYNSIKQIDDLKKRDENKTISFHCEQKEVPPCPLWKLSENSRNMVTFNFWNIPEAAACKKKSRPV